MPLAMTRPYPHPKTGVYWLRKVVPAALRAVVGKRELVQSLGTKSPREAREKAPQVLTRFDAILAAARNGGSPLTQLAVVALCGEWYRAECARFGENPGSEADWELELECLSDQLEEIGPEDRPEEWEHQLRLKPSDHDEAAAVLRQHGYVTDPASVTRMAEALFWTRRDLARTMVRRAEGDCSPDHTLDKFPALPSRKLPEPPPAVGITFSALVAAWAAESGTQGKALYDRERTATNLARHLGHDDATRVTADDVVSWKEARSAAGKSLKTVANDIGELRPIWPGVSGTASCRSWKIRLLASRRAPRSFRVARAAHTRRRKRRSSSRPRAARTLRSSGGSPGCSASPAVASRKPVRPSGKTLSVSAAIVCGICTFTATVTGEP
jgi:hypothetical protein